MRPILLFLVYFLQLLFFLNIPPLLASIYSLEDIEALIPETQFEEIISHALEVRPSQRKEGWNQQIRRSLLIYFQQTKQLPPQELLEKIQELEALPLWEKDEEFWDKRNSFHLFQLHYCVELETLGQKRGCLDRAISLWKKTPLLLPAKEFALGLLTLFFKEAREIKEIRETKETAFNFYKTLLLALLGTKKEGEQGAPYCWHKEVQEQAVSLFLKKDTEITDLIFKNCSSDFLPRLVSLFKQEDRAKREFLYPFLEKHAPDSIEYLLVYHVLSSDSSGDALFSQGLSLMEQLAQNFEKRQKILEQLKKETILPGKIFQNTSNILGKFLYYNFPEYLNFYAKSCFLLKQQTQELEMAIPLHCTDLWNFSRNTSKNMPQPLASPLYFPPL